MSGLSCHFCAHGNPEGSKYCNECGSPLHLTLCPRCEAINNLSAEQCFQCGASLSSATMGEMATPPVALTEISESTSSAETKAEPVPIALAESLQELPEHPHIVAPEPQAIVENQPFLAESLAPEAAGREDEGPASPPDVRPATDTGRRPNRARGLVLAIVFVAVGSAVYWMSVNLTHLLGQRSMNGRAPMTSAEPASSAPAAPPATGDSRTEPPAAGSSSSSAASTESPAAVGQSMSPSANAEPPTQVPSASPGSTPPPANAEPPAAALAPESENAQAPTSSKMAPPRAGGTAKTSRTRATKNTRRTPTQNRPKEQTERDATATQRLITRELANSPPAGSDDGQPSSP